jgi:DNA polymerase-1
MENKQEKIWICDLEGDHLKYKITTLWCVVAYDRTEQVYHISVPPEWYTIIEELINCEGDSVGLPLPDSYMLYDNHRDLLECMRDEPDKIVFHNGINFDFTVIDKLYPDLKIPIEKYEDTFIMSSLSQPDRYIPLGAKGPHSIDAYGRRAKMGKPGHDDWSKFSISMLYRCIEDVNIGNWTWDYLVKEMGGWDWSQSLGLEYGTARYHSKQEMNGCPFNLEYALKILQQIDEEIAELSRELLKIIPLSIGQPYAGPVNKPFKINGDYCTNLLKWFDKEEADCIKVSGPFSRITYEKINLDSSKQVKEYLKTQGWIPREWNYKKKNGRFVYEGKDRVKTSPKLTEDSYGSIKGGIGQQVARRNILSHRRTLLKSKDPKKEDTHGLINLIRDDGCIPAEGVPQAAVTGRYRHSKIVNIPAANIEKETGRLIFYPEKQKVPYGTELRSMFYCPDEDYVMVGIDASGLEARMEAHYCYPYPGGKEYAFDILDGDIHEKNAVFFDTDRNGAKSPKYALIVSACKTH